MKRRIAIILLLLTGGAIVNVAVTWTLSLVIDPFSIRAEEPRFRWGQRVTDEGRQWNASMWWRAGATRLAAYTSNVRPSDKNRGEHPDDVLPRWWQAGRFKSEPSAELWAKLGERELWEARLSEDELEQFVSFAEARGWPLLSMWHELRHSNRPTSRTQMEAHGGIELPLAMWADPMPFSSYDQPRTLPLRVIWWGCAMNTVFYGAMLCVVFFAPGMVKRALRRRRGQCETCAYPIGVNSVCTECGNAVRALNVESL